MNKVILLVLLVLLCPDSGVSKRGGGIGGSIGRGSSASRGSVGRGIGSSSSGRSSGSIFGGGTGGHGSGGSFGSGHRGSSHSYSRGNGIGSVLRSNQFKGAIAGAAAGYLTYRAGKALIRGAAMSMMWNNRPYYWGSSYYPMRQGYAMCRMPIEAGDPQLGSVYFEDGISRPKEIVWGCSSYEHCCGYECCPNGAGMGMGSPIGFGFGALIMILLLLCCGGFILYKFFRRSLDCILPGGNANRSTKYTPGQQQQFYPGQQQQQQQFYPTTYPQASAAPPPYPAQYNSPPY